MGKKGLAKFSIIVPLYNTPNIFLQEMIDSVLFQSYKNLELCLVDSSDEEHSYVGEICRQNYNNDNRIIYKKLEKNYGISGNTNECISISSGEYLVMLDHDDILHKDALQEIATVIENEDADFIYTDETKFNDDINKSFSPNYKPDFAPDELNAHNYICHLTVYKKVLLEKTGLYSSSHDGSQDHDMVLRLSEHAKHIVHIPKVLYYWRVHSGSVASNIAVKSYAVEAGHLAVRDHIHRIGLQGEVSSIPPYPSLYKVDYAIAHYSVNILIYDINNIEDVRKCISNLDCHQNWRGARITVIASRKIEAQVKKLLWSAPTVWPIELITYDEAQGPVINESVKKQQEEYCLFVSAKTFVDTDNFIPEMLMYAQRKDVGVVGGKVSDMTGHIIDYGCAILTNGHIKPLFKKYTRYDEGYEAILRHPRNTTGVLGNFCMIRKTNFINFEGLSDANNMPNSFIRLCLKMRQDNMLNVVIPFVECTYNSRKHCAGLVKETEYKYEPYYNKNIEQEKIF